MRGTRSFYTQRPCRPLLGWLLVLSSFAVAAGAEQARMPLLMPDDFSELNVVAWRVERGTRDPNNPLLEGDMPWDAGGVGVHGTVLKDPIDGLWKAWGVATPAEETIGPEVKSTNHHRRVLVYYESTDGVHWRRPELSNCSFGRHKKTNIIFNESQGKGSQYPSVIVRPANRDWPYEMFVYRQMYDRRLRDQEMKKGYTRLHRYRSRDGKAWEPVSGPIKGPFASDVCFIYPDERQGYVCYYRYGHDRFKNTHKPIWDCTWGPRVVHRVVSPDGETWPDKHGPVILKPDERDHRDTEYQELVPHQVKGGYLGMVTLYHPLTQTLNFRMAASRDGIHWWYPDRRPCLDNPPLGDYGGGMLWQNHNLIVEDNTLYVYYGGTEGIHSDLFDTRFQPRLQIGLESVRGKAGGILPFNSALCRASWRFDRMYALASAAGGPTVGMAVTKPRDLGGRQLRVNLLTRPPKKSKKPRFDEGYMQVELLDAEGKPLPGFTRGDCPLLRGDHQALQVRWTGGDRAPKGAKKAKFYLKRAFLYGFEFCQPTTE